MLGWLLAFVAVEAGGGSHLPAPTPAPWLEPSTRRESDAWTHVLSAEEASARHRLVALGATSAIVEEDTGAWLVTVAGGVTRRLGPPGTAWVGLGAGDRAYALVGGRLLRDGVDVGLPGAGRAARLAAVVPGRVVVVVTDTPPPAPLPPPPPPPPPGSKPSVVKESVAKKSLLLQMIGTSGGVSGGDAVSDLLGDDHGYGAAIATYEADPLVWRAAARLLGDGLRSAAGWARPPKVLLVEHTGDEAHLAALPAGCDPRSVDTYAGLVLLRCRLAEGDRVYAWSGAGWVDEGSVPARTWPAQVAEDGTVLFPAKGGAWVRPPAAPGATWRPLVSEGDEAWRVGPAGSAVAAAWADGLLRLRFVWAGETVHTSTTPVPPGRWGVTTREGRVELVRYGTVGHGWTQDWTVAVLDGPGAHAEVPVGGWPGAAERGAGGASDAVGGAAARASDGATGSSVGVSDGDATPVPRPRASLSWPDPRDPRRDVDGGAWVAVPEGLVRTESFDLWRDVPGPAQGQVPTALAGVDEHLWVGLPDGRTAHLDARAGRWRTWPAGRTAAGTASAGGKATTAVTGIWASRVATWAAFGERTRRYDVTRDVWRPMPLRGVIAYVVDAGGQGWVATDRGLYLDGERGLRRGPRVPIDAAAGPPSGPARRAPLTALAADAKAGVWVGGAGLWRVTTEGVAEDASAHVPGGTVRQLRVDRDGTVWVRGDDGWGARDPTTGAWQTREPADGEHASEGERASEDDRSLTLGFWSVHPDGRITSRDPHDDFAFRHAEVRPRSGFAAGDVPAPLADDVATMRLGGRTVGRPDLAVRPRAAAVEGARWWMVLADGTLLAGEGDAVAAPEPLPLDYVTAVVRRPGALCVGGSALLCRPDGGAWAPVGDVHDVTALAVDGDTLWAGTWGGLCRVGAEAACAPGSPVQAVVGDGDGGAWMVVGRELVHRPATTEPPNRWDERRGYGVYTSLARNPRTGEVWAARPERIERFAPGAARREWALTRGPVASVMVAADGTVWARVGDGLSRIE